MDNEIEVLRFSNLREGRRMGYALCRIGDVCTVHSVIWDGGRPYVNPHGRWEASYAHVQGDMDIYVGRFPRPAADFDVTISYGPEYEG